jgi:hypothetical protein
LDKASHAGPGAVIYGYLRRISDEGSLIFPP